MYEPCTYCKYKPGEEGGENGTGGGKRGGVKKKGGGGGKRGNSITERGKGGGGSGKYAADIKAGKIPGQPGDKKARLHNLCSR